MNKYERARKTRGMKPLHEWLAKRNAVPVWEENIPHIGKMAAFSVNGKAVYVMIWGGDDEYNGWEILTPVSNSQDVATVLRCADISIGL